MSVAGTVGIKLGWDRVLRVQRGLTLAMAIIPGFVKTLCRLVPPVLRPPEVTQTLILGMNP